MAYLEGTVRENRAKSQHPYIKGRMYRVAKDQHGRQWGAECDNRTNDPVGPLTPKFRAPWLPPIEYVRWEYDPEEGRFSVRIRYDELKAKRRQDDAEWVKRLMQVGPELNGQAFDPSRPSLEVLAKVGPRPESIRVALMAEKGDAWVLGLTERATIPAWAVPYFPPPLSADERELQAMEAELAELAGVAAEATPAPAAPKRRGRAA